MGPQFFPERLFVQLRHPDPVPVGGHFFRRDVHGDFRQVQVGANPPGGGDARLPQYAADDGGDQLVGSHAVQGEVGRQVHKGLVDGVDVDVLGRQVLEVDAVDLGGHLQVPGHPGHGGDVLHLVPGAAFDLRQFLFDFKEPGPPWHPQGFQRGAHRQADGAVRPALVRHHQVGGQGV